MSTKIKRPASEPEEPISDAERSEVAAHASVTQPIELVDPTGGSGLNTPTRELASGLVRRLFRNRHSRFLCGDAPHFHRKSEDERPTKRTFEPGWHTLPRWLAEDLGAVDTRKSEADMKLFGRSKGDRFEMDLGEIRNPVES